MQSNWEVRKLGDIYRIGSSKRVLKSQWKTEGVPFYRGREVTRLAADGFVNNELFISEEHFAELSTQYGVPKYGDIVITAIGTIGNSYIVQGGDRFYFKDASVLWMKRTSEVSSEFVKFWLKSPLFFDKLDKGNGATVDTLTIQKLQSVELLLPPLPEQQRIVAILDEAFAAISKAKENAEKNLKNARELFESYLQSVFANPGDGWELVALSDLATDITNGDHMPPPKAQDGIPFITISNINKSTNQIDFSDTFKVPMEYYQNLKPNKKPAVGDILYTVTGSYGIPVIVCKNIEFCFQRHIGLVRPKNGIDSKWMYYLLKSPDVLQQASEGATGTAQKTVSLKVLRNIQVQRIPFLQQQSIVTKLDALSLETKKLETIYRQKLVALDELRKSLLQKAFSGQLTAAQATIKRAQA